MSISCCVLSQAVRSLRQKNRMEMFILKAKRIKRITVCLIALLMTISVVSWQPVLAAQAQFTMVHEDGTKDNGTPETAQEIGVNIRLTGENIENKDGSDMYRLVVNHDGVLHLNFSIAASQPIQHGVEARAFVSLTRSGGYIIAAADQTTVAHPEAVVCGIKAGTYYITIAQKVDSSFYYTLDLVFDEEYLSEPEPDDDSGHPVPIIPGASQRGNIGLTGNDGRDSIDCYSVTLNEAGQLKVQLDVSSHMSLTTGLLFYVDGNIAYSLGDVSAGQSKSFVTDNLRAGTYQLYMGGAYQLGDNDCGSYKITTTFTPEKKPDPVRAVPSSASVTVNGKLVALQAYNIGGANYFKLRDLAYILQNTDKSFEAQWDGAANAILLTTHEPYSAVGGEMSMANSAGARDALPTGSTLSVDGDQVLCSAYTIGGNNYFKLRDIAALIDFAVEWDQQTSTISIDTSRGYTAN